VNLEAGRQPLLHAEDVLRYGAKGIEVNREAVVNLFRSVKKHRGVETVRISHFALSSVAAAPEVVEDLSNILELSERRWISGQTGIETGSPHLMSQHMRGKCKPFKPSEWPDVVFKAFAVLSENMWVPCSTLVLGLPGENERDVETTISLVEKLRAFKSLIIPLFLVSTGELTHQARSFTAKDMSRKHTELFVECWEHNLKWGPTIIREWTESEVRNPMARHSLRLIFSYGIERARMLAQTCRDEYDYSLDAMIRDARSGKIVTAPLAAKAVYRLVKARKRQ